MIDVTEGSFRFCCGSRTKAPQADHIAVAVKTCSIRRMLPLPIGTIVAAILALPWAYIVMLVSACRAVPPVVYNIQLINHSKWCYYMGKLEGKLQSRGLSTCCKFCHWYTSWYLLFSIVLFIALPILIVVLSLLGAIHATYAVGKRAFIESDMFDEAKAGGVLDRIGYMDAPKEQLAESMATWPCGIGLFIMWVGDWLTFTGIIEGYRRIEAVRYVHGSALGTLRKTLYVALVAEDTFHLTPISTILSNAGKAADTDAASSFAAQKKAHTDAKKESPKAPPQTMADLIAFVSLIVSVVFWLAFMFIEEVILPYLKRHATDSE